MLTKIAQTIRRHIAGKPVFHILLIAAIGLLAYSNTFQAPFQWDENVFLRENPIVKNLNYFLAPSEATGIPFYNSLLFRYIGYLTFAVNYKLHGFAVQGYHIVNICIHLINAALIYFLVLLTFRTPCLKDSPLSGKTKAIAFSVSLLFAIHPVQTEAVTYVFQRFASLAALFYLLSLTSYIQSRLDQGKQRRLFFYGISFVAAILAMKTKENAFTLPFVITLYEFCFFSSPRTYNRSPITRFYYLAPLLLTMCIIPSIFIRLIIGSGTHFNQIMTTVATADVGYAEMPRWPYLFTQFRVIITYLRLMFVPVNQNLVYDYPLYKSFFIPQVIASFIFLLALFTFGVCLVVKSQAKVKVQVECKDKAETDDFRLIGFGILWFFITLSVESSIIPLPTLIDEYRMYLPSVGFFIALCTALFMVAGKMRFDRERRMLLQLSFLVIAVLFGMTYARNGVWGDRIAFWKDVIQKSPKVAGAYNNLGKAYLGIYQPDKALETFDRAVILAPKFVLAWDNRGEAFLQKKEYDHALENFAKADAIQKNSRTYTEMGIAYLEKDEPSLAIENVFKALAMDPSSERAHYALALCYARSRKYSEAIPLFNKILLEDPYNPDAHLNRGEIYMAHKEYARAAADFTDAVKLDTKNIVALYKCAIAYHYLGQYDSAIREYTSAIALDNKSPALYDSRGLSFYSKKDYVRSIVDYTKAIELNPAYAPTYAGRGLDYLELKEFDHALADFNKALSLDRKLAVAYTNRGNFYLKTGDNAEAVADFRRGCALKDADACSRIKKLNRKNSGTS